jgi:O-succinylbenzoic acid--CoA ligase
LDADGYLYILGRAGHLIITGGEKVQPEEVEAAILATGLALDAIVVGIPDPDWGERVVALWVPQGEVDSQPLQARLKTQLSAYKVPKAWWVQIPNPPQCSGQGKSCCPVSAGMSAFRGSRSRHSASHVNPAQPQHLTM